MFDKRFLIKGIHDFSQILRRMQCVMSMLMVLEHWVICNNDILVNVTHVQSVCTVKSCRIWVVILLSFPLLSSPHRLPAHCLVNTEMIHTTLCEHALWDKNLLAHLKCIIQFHNVVKLFSVKVMWLTTSFAHWKVTLLFYQTCPSSLSIVFCNSDMGDVKGR